MERVLDGYKRPFDPLYPVVCRDESPKQLIAETREAIPASPGQPARYDYEYRRCGTCNIFLASEPLAGKRMVKITEQRTRQDWAVFLQDIAEQYPTAERILLVMGSALRNNWSSEIPSWCSRLHAIRGTAFPRVSPAPAPQGGGRSAKRGWGGVDDRHGSLRVGDRGGEDPSPSTPHGDKHHGPQHEDMLARKGRTQGQAGSGTNLVRDERQPELGGLYQSPITEIFGRIHRDRLSVLCWSTTW